jgi:hypothetical protein
LSTPRYVCLSDLHLGAGYSTLTSTDARGEPDPTRPSATLVALGQALRQLLRSLGDGPPPTLVLLGDVLDMGLSPMGSVAAAFDCFVQAVMLDGDRPLFAPRVLCVPGNHDHHLWRIAQDQHFQDGLREGRIERDLIAQTALFQEPGARGIPSPMLNGLMQRHAALRQTSVEIAYPNLGLLDAGRQRCVVLHHGHYVDPMYRVVSALDAQTPGLHGRGPASMAQLEARNGAWVDFLWSDLGSAGLTGTAATKLYEVMRDGGASQRFAQRLSALLVARLGTRFGLSGSMPMVQGITLEQLLPGLLDATLGRGAESQRDSYLALMTASDVADLRWFLSGPVKLELERAGLQPCGLDLAFVFGHTHKPFQDELPVAGFERPVRVFNTGGWVMDQPTMTSTQGAAAVFIDEALNLASLRLFNDPVNGRMAPVQAQGVGGFGDRDNPMLAALAAGIERTAPTWQAFSCSAQTATEAHATRLLDKFFHVPGHDPATAP